MNMHKNRNKAKNKNIVAKKGFSSLLSSRNDLELGLHFSKFLEACEWKKAADEWKKQIIRSRRTSHADIIPLLKDYIYKGKELLEASSFSDAAPYYCKVLAYDPGNLDALRNLAYIDVQQDRPKQALDLINEAISIRSDIASFWSVKVLCLVALEMTDEFHSALQTATSLGCDRRFLLADASLKLSSSNPDIALKLNRLLYHEYSDNLDDQAFSSLLKVSSRYLSHLTYREIDWLSRSLYCDPNIIASITIELLSFVASEIQCDKFVQIQQKVYEHFSELVAIDPLPTLALPAILKPQRKIRIGFVGGDFCKHVVSMFLLPLVEGLDQSKYDIFCFSTRSRVDDDERRRYEKTASVVDIVNLSPRDLALSLRQYNLDVCIDVAGHTAYSALSSFAWRMAPIQISMIGSPCSTFIPNIDYMLVDQYLAPDNAQTISEKPLFIEGSAYCYDTNFLNAEVSQVLPQERYGFVNYGVLINPWKYSPQIIEAWARILHLHPQSQISFVRPEGRSLEFQANLINAFAENGIGKERLLIVNNHGRNISHLDCYNQIDVVLDTAPMTGGTSTMEAILMGLPVVSVYGPCFHQRISHAMLNAAGLGECSVPTIDQYIHKALEVSSDLAFLKSLRANAVDLRSASHGLCDARSYARRFEDALKSLGI